MIDKELNSKNPTNFTFTAMHGVGHEYMVEAAKVCGFKVTLSTQYRNRFGLAQWGSLMNCIVDEDMKQKEY